jgi:AraC-like DNA-binding protein
VERRRALAAEARELIRGRVGDNPSIDEVARAVGTSRRQLQRVLEEEGTSYRDAVTAAALDHAEFLLVVRPELSIGGVATACGYRSQAHFTKAFKDHTGVTPTQYQRRARDGAARQNGGPPPAGVAT